MNRVPMPPLTEESLRALFTKPYGVAGPAAEQWRAVYDESVYFQDPTQEKRGIDAYIQAQEGLMRRCDDVFLEPVAVALSGDTAFVEWTMGLKIKGLEFVIPAPPAFASVPTEKSLSIATTSISLDPPLHRCLCWVVLCAGSTDDSCPEGGQGRWYHQQHNFIYECVCRSPHWPCIGANDQPALGGQKRQEDSIVLQTISLLAATCLVGFAALQLLFTIGT